MKFIDEITTKRLIEILDDKRESFYECENRLENDYKIKTILQKDIDEISFELEYREKDKNDHSKCIECTLCGEHQTCIECEGCAGCEP